jgi:hypothetical protein
MLDASPQAVLDLRTRTRARNRVIWTPMLGTTALALDEANLNALFLDTIEAPIAIADEVYQVKEYERDQAHTIALQQANLELQGILDGFGFVQSKLTDLFALWQIKDRIVALKIQNAYDLIAATDALLTAELQGVTLQLTAMQNEQIVLDYEKIRTQAEIAAEAALKAQLLAAKEALQNFNQLTRIQINDLRAQMELLDTTARRWVFLHQDHVRLVQTMSKTRIGKLA